MPREVEKQADQYSQSPHVRFKDLDRGGDHAYATEPRGHDLTDQQYLQHEQAGADEETGYNWGPPPDQDHLHDPGFTE